MNSTPKPVRIGNAQAFWGDRTDAAAEMLAREPGLDYLTLDYLAEVSMSILAMQRERDPSAGYAREFVEVVRSLIPYWSSGGRCRVVTNAGGLNPQGCAAACRAILAEAGCRSLKIGIVSGDDVLELVRAAENTSSPDFQNLDTGAKLHDARDRLVTANAYLGASPIVEALAGGADIVITGRAADPSLVVAPCLHHFGWNEKELDRLAGATVAGHLIECGTQVTGGISTDWLDVPDAAHIGFPIVEVSDDGSCIVTKPRGTGGRVTEMIVKEQLLYEIGDPDNYLSPDVTVSFLTLAVEDLGKDRVRVSGATGKPRPKTLKVSATFRDGFRAAGTLTLVGRNARAKARRVGALVLQRVRDLGFTLRDTIVETISSVVSSDQKDSPHPEGIEESVLRVAVEADNREAVERFSRELMPYITAGPQGTTGYAEGRPRVHQIFRYWPCLISQDAVAPQIEVLSSSSGAAKTPSHAAPPSVPRSPAENAAPLGHSQLVSMGAARTPTHLYDIAVARSGDKGTSANIGVIVRHHDWWELLEKWLTADAVATYFAPMGIESVERFELPNLGALNFVIRGALRRSLRTDAQGKALGQILLEMPLPEDATK
jgi:Acyclic terpene utilisation family protein AtuA